MSLEWNKIAAAVLLAGVVAMFAGTLTNHFLYPAAKETARGYQIEGAEEAGATQVAAEKVEIDVLALISTAIANGMEERGQKVAKKCISCHTFEQGGKHKVGPALWNIVGKDVAPHGDFSYSKAMAGLEGTWNYERLYAFLDNPKKYLKGTKMAFAGLKKPEDIAALIAYLRAQSSSPFPAP